MACYDVLRENPPFDRYVTNVARDRRICVNDVDAQKKYKAKVLEYRANSSNLTTRQRYAQISKGSWTNRTTTWASQTETYTNPNILNLERGNYGLIERVSLIKPINDIYECNNNTNYNQENYNSLPSQQTKSNDYEQVIIPPRILQPSIETPIPFPKPVLPNLYSVFIRDGGILICNTQDTICSTSLL
jgi:hypothetical protein